MKNEADILGQNIRLIRKAQNMTQLDTEIESGIFNSNISNYELGNRFSKLDTITILAYGLKVEAYELFSLQ
ncbi:hypothetical protein FLA_1632 [Filimonas lacunae]|nr:hypothetical protein FLA_1632 [Filimonas lacunae]